MAEDNPPAREFGAESASDDRFRAIFERAGVGLVLIDGSCTIIDTNQAFCEIVGRSASDLIGTSCMAITHPDDVPVNERVIARLANPEEQTASFEKRYVREGGTHVWVRINLTKIPFDEGERVLAVVEDISDRKTAECALEETGRRLDAILNNTRMAVFMMDERQQCVFMNRAAEELTGYTLEETRGRPLHDVIHHTRPDGSPYPLRECPIDRAFPEVNQVEGEEMFVHKDGHFYPVAFTASPIRDERGEAIGTVIEVRNIEREKAQERATRQSEQRFRALFENAGVGMIEMDSDWRILGANPVYSKITGFSRDELIGRSSLSFTHPDDIAKSEEALAAIRAGETPGASFDKRYIRKDGTIVWVRSNVTDVGDGERFLKIVEDIDSAKRAQEALRESAERLRLVVETAVDAIVVIDEKGIIQAFNSAAEAMFGYSSGEALGRNVRLLMPEPHRERHDEYIEAYRRTGKRKIIGIGREVEGRRKDGSLFPLDLAIAEGTDGRGHRFFTGIMRDISERKQAEAALEEERHTLETLNRVGTALAAELDLERLVQMITDAGVELTGAQFGAFFYNVVNDDGEAYMLYTLSGAERSQFEKFGMPRNTKLFAPTFAGEGIVRSDDIRKDPRYGKNPPHNGMPKGHLPVVSYLAVPVVGRSGEVIGGLFFGHAEPGRFRERHERLMEGIVAQAAIAIDNARLFQAAQREIEQRMTAEQALTALNETLESRVAEEIAARSRAEEVLRQTQKMETVGQLSGGIAHDFNNLLQIIHGNLSLLQRALPSDQHRWHRAVTNALTGTERAAALTQRLLAFSRRQPLDPKPLDVNGMIEDMIELLHRTIGETIAIETDLAKDLPPALVDVNQLENAVLNLAINARDAMPRGGRLEICTSLAELDEAAATRNPDAAPGRYVRIAVRDTGLGMNPDVLSRAIEPFFSTKEVGQGTGLGLSMVYGFVKQSGGHLLLDSAEGRGTTVELFLPCSEMAADQQQNRQQESDLPRGKGERILLCEDDEDVRRFSSETLRDLGYNVIEATDAESALATMRSNGGIDLLFTDIVLPGGKTGADLAREARELQPDLKVLFATGYARSALDERRDAGSGIELLIKPFGVDALAIKLRTILDA